MKDDSGSYAAFTKQGPSSSQMTAAKVIDVIARLRTADAVSACTQVRVSRHLDTSTTTQNGPNRGPTSEEKVVLLERNLYGHPFAGLLWERHFEEVLLELGCGRVPNWECLFVRRKQRPSQVRGSGMTFLPITIPKEVHWNPPTRNWSSSWCSTLIETKRKQTALYR